MSDNISDMYSDAIQEIVTPQSFPNFVNVTNKNTFLKELDISGQKVTMLDPSIIKYYESIIFKLETRVRKLENDVISINANARMLQSNIQNISKQMDNKVSYD
jgi:hypothetical protein